MELGRLLRHCAATLCVPNSNPIVPGSLFILLLEHCLLSENSPETYAVP